MLCRSPTADGWVREEMTQGTIGYALLIVTKYSRLLRPPRLRDMCDEKKLTDGSRLLITAVDRRVPKHGAEKEISLAGI
jgi:hypothetical protein